MKKILENKCFKQFLYIFFFLIILTIVLFFLIFQNYQLKQSEIITKNKLTKTENNLASTTKAFKKLEKEWGNLNQQINSELAKINSITNQVQGITGDVTALNKLVETDPELLQKYSKTYFLNENYFPENLAMIDIKNIINPTKDLWFKKEALPFLEELLNKANKDSGLNLKILSAFRSFETQSQLKSNYSLTYGEKTANKFSADQGYSEHQLGTAVDFTTTNIGSNLESFKKEKEYQWLLKTLIYLGLFFLILKITDIINLSLGTGGLSGKNWQKNYIMKRKIFII